MTRRGFLGVSASGLGGLWLGDRVKLGAAQSPPASSSLEGLYSKFQDPDRKYSMRPYWFWNGKLDADEVGRQIRQMVDHGVYGAYAFNRAGLETPYHSEEWWRIVGSALKVSREVGFSLCMVDDFEWPSGETRDFWLPGKIKSRVVAANPDYRMKRLRPVETTVLGPSEAQIPLPAGTMFVVGAKRLGSDRLDGSSLSSLSFSRDAKIFTWNAPDGEWLVTVYALEPTQTYDHASVDLMNSDAVRKFIDIYYEEFNSRYGEYLGNTVPATFADQEGAYGRQIAWTPRLFETFARMKGYKLERLLPGLCYDIGELSEKVRCDYLDVVSELYSASFFKQVNEWCAAHKMEYSSHMWEESLFLGPAYNGDVFKVLRAMGKPGCDTLFEWGRQSVWLKETASVADFTGRRAACEHQGVQGVGSYVSPEDLRRVSNCLGAWNISEFISHAFNYDLSRVNYPPDWFRGQPFLPWFRAYADQMRRIGFMNSESHHLADLLLYYPQVSIWGQSAAMFRKDSQLLGRLFGILSNDNWPEDAVVTNSRYAMLKWRLTENRLDYKIADDSFLAESHLEGAELVISTSRFRTVVLPPMSTMRRSSAEKIGEFYRAGGTVVAMGRLPLISPEKGRDDQRLKELWASMFDDAPSSRPFTLRTNDHGGRACFVPGLVDDVVDLLGQIVDHDLDVVDGPSEHLFFLHKQIGGLDFYWIVNDSAVSRTNLLSLRALGRPERWDAPTGKRMPVFYQTNAARTLVRLALGPWDATYLVFDPSGPAQPLALKATNVDEFSIDSANTNEVIVRGWTLVKTGTAFVELSGAGREYRGEYRPVPVEPMDLSGEWQVTVEAPSISLPYADLKEDPHKRGQRERWYAGSDGENWHRLWLSPMNCGIRKWNLIGPFLNSDDNGLETVYPPERETNFNAEYEGDGRRAIHWVTIDNDEDRIDASQHWPDVLPGRRQYDAHSNLVDYGVTLRMGEYPEGTVYAQAYVYAPESQDAIIVLNTPNPNTVWFNGAQVFTKWVRPIYCDPTDGFSSQIPVRANAGWNTLLLKFIHNAADVNATAGYPSTAAFTCRVEGREGKHVKGLLAHDRPMAPGKAPTLTGSRWLRFRIPPVARALRVPELDGKWSAFVDGNPVSSTREMLLPPSTRQVVVQVGANERLDHPFELLLQSASMLLEAISKPSTAH